MSATGRGTERSAGDWYPTPGYCVRRFLEACPVAGTTVLEPGAGTGVIIQNANAVFPGRFLWTAVEVDRSRYAQLKATGAEVWIGDFLADPRVDAGRWDLAIGNPPYSLAQEFVERCFGRVRTIAFLLRVNFMASEERVEFHRRYPADVWVLPNRPSFSGNGKGDATEYAWWVWGPQSSGKWKVLDPTPLTERIADRTAA